MSSDLAFAFLVGTMTTANPCGLALLPAYFARRLGIDCVQTSTSAATIAEALKIGFVTSLGVVLVFGLVGVVFSLGASWVVDAVPWAGLAVGGILAVLGVWVMAGGHIHVRVPMGQNHAQNPPPGLRGDAVYGVGYGVVSLSCTLPILLTITGLSLNSSVASSALNFVAFTLGVGTVFTAISVSAALARNGLVSVLKRFLPYVYRASGALLFLAGVYVMYLWADALFVLAGPDRVILGTGERLSGLFKVWLDGSWVQELLWGVLIVLAALSVWAFTSGQGEEKQQKP